MNPVIKVTNLSKRYRIGGLHPAHTTFRDFLAGAIAKPFRRLPENHDSDKGILWALRDINFNIYPGEVVGIIGNNGAGKSTLLKILSKITAPTTGRTEVYGRLGSLLEVGTGFHPDLTGRENIFLNSAILGIKRSVIKRKLDEIIAFSEIEGFIDTPVKWYSSGMYLRLAFSVAIHTDAEVLFMDEVLAVGDASFQHKCLNKLYEIRKQGRTILFVSHNMVALTRLCKRAIWLDNGHIVKDGPAHQIANNYLGASWKIQSSQEWTNTDEAPGNETVRLCRVCVRDEEGRMVETADLRHPVGIELAYQVLQPGQIITPRIDLFSDTGVHLFVTIDDDSIWRHRPRPVGSYVSTVWVPGNLLAEGNMLIHVSLLSPPPSSVLHALVPNAVTFRVVDHQNVSGLRGDLVGPISGIIRPLLNWTTDFESIEEANRA